MMTTFRRVICWGFLGCGVMDAAVVTTCDEGGLRAASSAGGTVTFACDGVITVSNTITVDQDTIFDASGRSVTISGNSAVRVFNVNTGISFTVVHVTIANGLSTNGGGICNEGILTLLQCNVLSNSAVGLNGIAGTNGTRGNGTNGATGGPGGDGGNGAEARGGGIYNRGLLRVTNSTFAANLARGGLGGAGGNGGGGGAYHDQFGRCVAGTSGGNAGVGGVGGDSFGGSLFNLGDAVLTGCSWFSNSVAAGDGGLGGSAGANACGYGTNGVAGSGGAGGNAHGGAYCNAGLLTIRETVLASNEAHAGRGGAGADDSSFPFPQPAGGGRGGQSRGGAACNLSSNELINVTLTSNRAAGGDGGFGGLYNLIGCPAKGGDGGDAWGGGVFNSGELSVVNCTIWNNTGTGGTATNNIGPACPQIPVDRFGTNGMSLGSAIAALEAAALWNTIVGGNTNHCFGMILDAGHNLCSDGRCGFASDGSLNNTDPKLGPLANNGGPTLTMALGPGSPALNHANNATCPLTDQRGVLRPQQGHCDIGAFEQTFLSITTNSTGSFRVEYAGVPNQSYLLQTSTDLKDWMPQDSVPANSNGLAVFEIPGDPPGRFFRVRLQ